MRPPRPEDDALTPFEEPEVAQPLEIEHRSGGGPASPKLTIDRGNGRATLSIVTHDSVDRLVEADLVVEEHAVDTYSIVEGDPLSAETRADWTIGLSRGDWRTKVEDRERDDVGRRLVPADRLGRGLRRRPPDLLAQLDEAHPARPHLTVDA